MKTFLEVSDVHDLLQAVLLDDIENPWEGLSARELTLLIDLLCWILDHEHNRNFADNLLAARRLLQARGVERVFLGRMKSE